MADSPLNAPQGSIPQEPTQIASDHLNVGNPTVAPPVDETTLVSAPGNPAAQPLPTISVSPGSPIAASDDAALPPTAAPAPAPDDQLAPPPQPDVPVASESADTGNSSPSNPDENLAPELTPDADAAGGDGKKTPLEILEEILAGANAEKEKEEDEKRQKEEAERLEQERKQQQEQIYQEHVQSQLGGVQQALVEAKDQREQIEQSLKDAGVVEQNAAVEVDDQFAIHQLTHKLQTE